MVRRGASNGINTGQSQKKFNLNRGNNPRTIHKNKTMNTNSNSPGSRKLQMSMERLQVQQPNINRRAAGSNWQRAAAMGSENQKQQISGDEGVVLTKSARSRMKRKAYINRFLAMDCEMVGIGINGQDAMLARVSIVNKDGAVLLDKHVKPREPVTDYRTKVSGIRPHDIENGEDFFVVQDEVAKLLHGKILVGHALRNDLAVLGIKHPALHIRDTSRYKPLCKLVSNGHTPSLKRLALAVLGQEIQTGEHNSVEDARAAMNIYNCIAADWEKYLERRQQQK